MTIDYHTYIKSILTESMNQDWKIQSAYWISPSAKVVEVNKIHIQTVIDFPNLFGLNKDYISGVYNLHQEKIGTEGKAREDIIRNLMETGWIRIRNYGNFWSLTLNKMTERKTEIIYDFVKQLVERIGISKYTEFRISTDTENYDLSLDDILQFKLYKMLVENKPTKTIGKEN